MSLTLALNNALSGLNINQRSLATLSNNIANANTVGHSRQKVDQSALVLGGMNAGVRLEDVTRTVDEFLRRSVQSKTTDVAYATSVDEYMERIQVFMGDPGGEDTIDEKIEIFFNAVQTLAETPERSSIRQTTVNTGEVLARDMSDLALALETLRLEADGEMHAQVTFANDVLEELHLLNRAIKSAYMLGNSTATLLDRRDMALENLASLVDIRTITEQTGEVSVFTSSGITLLDDTLHELSYERIPSLQYLVDNDATHALEVYRLDSSGKREGVPIALISEGVEGGITTELKSGKIKALHDIRDQLIPEVLAELDELAAQLRDRFNAIHNDGSSFPGAEELVGTREVIASERFEYSGEVRIAVLMEDGTAPPSGHTDEVSGLRPLTMDLSKLNDGVGFGNVSVQTIVDEINNHFRSPQDRVVLGNLNQIQLAAVSDDLTSVFRNFEFDFDLENISDESASFFVNNIQVLDDTAADITSVTNTAPVINLASYVTTAASTTVRVGTTAPHGLSNGDYVFLSDPGVAIDGIPNAEFNTYLQVSNVTANSFEITVVTPAVAGASTVATGETATPSYDTVVAGAKERTQDQGTFIADMSGNPNSTYYDIIASVAVVDASGNLSTEDITYRILNQQVNIRNQRFSADAIGAGAGTLETADSAQAYLRATLVDIDGNEVSRVNGLIKDTESYLKLEVLNSNFRVHIDELSSQQLGRPNESPPQDGTNRGFSHYFELNNFFSSNQPIATGDTVTNSAINLAVEKRLLDNASLISTGDLQLSNQPADPTLAPLYTYERFIGDNSVAQRMAGLGVERVTFAAAGVLPETTLTFNSYAGELTGQVAADTITAENNLRDNEILLNGFAERSDAVSGVNLDEELANTIVFQHAYAASAQVITVTRDLFDILLSIGQ